MAEEQTLVLVKPDGVANGHIGDVITRIEHRGFTIDALKVTHATADQLHQHYAALVGEPFFPRIEPAEAAPGTIRGDFGREWADKTIRNVIHSSDSETSARREIPIWFPDRQYAPHQPEK